MNLDRLNILVDHFTELGDYEMAETLVKQILQLKEREFGKCAPELIIELYNLALLQEAQDCHNNALKNAKKAYAIARNYRTSEEVDIFEIREIIKRLTSSQVA